MLPTASDATTCAFTMPVTGWLLGPSGIVQGGLLATLADGAFGLAVQTQIGPCTRYATADLSMTFLRPVTLESRTLTATGRAIHVGRSLGLADAAVVDDRGRMIAHGTSRCSIFPPTPADARATWNAGERAIAEPAAGISDPYLRDPRGDVLDATVWATHSGLDILSGLVSGAFPAPPITHLCGLVPTEALAGECSFALPASEWFNSPAQRLQGGVTAWLAETALSGAVLTTAPPGTAVRSVGMTVNFLRPVHADGGTLHAHGTVVHRGRTLAISRAEVRDSAGHVAALATGSTMLLSHARASRTGR
jgi:uncharacterized protein (TIGR00369 family)